MPSDLAPTSPRPGHPHVGSAASLHPQTGRAAGECGRGPGRDPKHGPACLVTVTASSQARRMTLQAMALQQWPLSPAPRPLPPEVSLACPSSIAPGHHCASLSRRPQPVLGRHRVPECRLVCPRSPFHILFPTETPSTRGTAEVCRHWTPSQTRAPALTSEACGPSPSGQGPKAPQQARGCPYSSSGPGFSRNW